MTFFPIIVGVIWAILGFLTFQKFVTDNKDQIHQLSTGALKTTIWHVFIAMSHVVMGGPIIWGVGLWVITARTIQGLRQKS